MNDRKTPTSPTVAPLDTRSTEEPENLLDLLRDAGGITPESDTDQALTPAEKFEKYHRENPAVYRAMVLLCQQWINRTGRRKLGINSLVERVRWEIAIATNDPEFKINNNFAPWYARLIMRQEPELAELFDLRRSVADDYFGRAA